jgi:hypothetical protein
MTANADSKTSDKIVYFGVININENTKTVGAIDVWRSVPTKDIFCEEKRLGVLDISDQIGMPTIEENKKWAVAISRKKTGKNRWKLIKLIEQGKFKFADADDKTYDVDVKGYKIIDNDWWSFLVESNVNRNIDVNKETNAK